MRHEDALYYILSYPTGTSMLISSIPKASPPGMLYDPYSGMLESDLSEGLVEVMAGTGSFEVSRVGWVEE